MQKHIQRCVHSLVFCAPFHDGEEGILIIIWWDTLELWLLWHKGELSVADFYVGQFITTHVQTSHQWTVLLVILVLLNSITATYRHSHDIDLNSHLQKCERESVLLSSHKVLLVRAMLLFVGGGVSTLGQCALFMGDSSSGWYPSSGGIPLGVVFLFRGYFS